MAAAKADVLVGLLVDSWVVLLVVRMVECLVEK